jgi:hypothetical protein
MATDDEFLAAFESCTWPLDQWHHRQHIKVAYLYLRRFPFETAVARMRERIQAYNAANQVPDGPDRGYHETVTQAWMRLVHYTLEAFGPCQSADAFIDGQSQLLSARALLFFYSRQRITSSEAKYVFLEPDLTRFPQIRSSYREKSNRREIN